MATSEDIDMATREDSFMATDTTSQSSTGGPILCDRELPAGHVTKV